MRRCLIKKNINHKLVRMPEGFKHQALFYRVGSSFAFQLTGLYGDEIPLKGWHLSVKSDPSEYFDLLLESLSPGIFLGFLAGVRCHLPF